MLELTGPLAATQLSEELQRLNPAECLLPDRLAPDTTPTPGRRQPPVA